MSEHTGEAAPSDGPIRSWKHDRVGRVVGRVTRETDEWITIVCTEDNGRYDAGEAMEFRKSLVKETTPVDAPQADEDIDANLATIGRVERVVLDMNQLTERELTSKVLHLLHDLLVERDAWTLILEGMWEEYVKPGGVLNPASYDDQTSAEAVDAQFDREAFVRDLEERAQAIGVLAYADDMTAKYTIEADA